MQKNLAGIFLFMKLLLALLMVGAGIFHIVNPKLYVPFVPQFLPFKVFIIYASGVVEILLGLMLLSKKYAITGAWGIFLLMLVFLPIHVADVFSDAPAIGSHQMALIRLALQFVILLWVWVVKNSIKRSVSIPSGTT
ncbi:MAG: hypothetical protein ABI168_02795 [Ginsengibacter sp.]